MRYRSDAPYLSIIYALGNRCKDIVGIITNKVPGVSLLVLQQWSHLTPGLNQRQQAQTGQRQRNERPDLPDGAQQPYEGVGFRQRLQVRPCGMLLGAKIPSKNACSEP